MKRDVWFWGPKSRIHQTSAIERIDKMLRDEWVIVGLIAAIYFLQGRLRRVSFDGCWVFDLRRRRRR